MAIVVVAATKLRATSGTSVTVSVSATAGNALLVGGESYNGTTFTVTRTGDTYTTDISGVSSAGANRSYSGIASAPNVAGGAVNMVVSSASAGGITAHALEVSGLATSSIRDATSPAIKTGSTASASSNSLTNVTADAIFFAAYGNESGDNPGTITSGSGWTQVVGGTTMTETNGAASPAGGQQYDIVSTTGAVAGAWTGPGATWVSCIAVYKMAAGGGAQDTPELYGRPYGLRGQSQMHQLLAQ